MHFLFVDRDRTQPLSLKNKPVDIHEVFQLILLLAPPGPRLGPGERSRSIDWQVESVQIAPS